MVKIYYEEINSSLAPGMTGVIGVVEKVFLNRKAR